jgi:SOS regulatory protein LexA
MYKKSNVDKPASKKQTEVLDFISFFRQKKGYAPSLSEIAKNFSVSIPTIHQHVSYLRKKNLLTSEKGKKRSIQTFNFLKNGFMEIPLMGLIAAGGPIEAIRDPRPIQVPKNMISVGHNYYALKIAGVSMIEDGICDGDIVVVQEQSTVDDGEKAVVYLPDKDSVTLKRIFRDKNRIKLVPANKNIKPWYETNVEIQGKVVGVLRNEY